MKRSLIARTDPRTTLSIAWTCVFWFVLPAFAAPQDDPVFQRYGRKLKPSPIQYEFDMKIDQLERPATQKEVDRGAAIFTFDGLGTTRVWRLPTCPMSGHWVALRDFPLGIGERDGVIATNLDNFGLVIQAEELLV